MESNQISTIQAQAPQQEGDAPEVEGEQEQANYVNNSRPAYDPNSKTYNPGWKINSKDRVGQEFLLQKEEFLRCKHSSKPTNNSRIKLKYGFVTCTNPK